MLLQESGQRAIIDHCSANGFQSSGCAGGRAPGIANSGWRVEHEKEIYEAGNEQLFWKAFARQLHHKRDQIIVTLRSNETQIRYGFRTVQHIGVREHEPCGIERACALKALVDRPQFPGPPCRQGLALNHNKGVGFACFFCGAPCHIRCTGPKIPLCHWRRD